VGLAQLDNLVRIRQMKAEPAAQSEIDGLIRSGTARLNDSQTEALSLDGRFDLAYNAAHALSLAALGPQTTNAVRQRTLPRFSLLSSALNASTRSPHNWAIRFASSPNPGISCP